MKYDLSGSVTDQYGTPFKRANAQGVVVDYPIHSICADACYAAPMNGPLNLGEAMKRYEVGKKLESGPLVELTTDDLVIVKSALAGFCSPRVIGEICAVLESATGGGAKVAGGKGGK